MRLWMARGRGPLPRWGRPSETINKYRENRERYRKLARSQDQLRCIGKLVADVVGMLAVGKPGSSSVLCTSVHSKTALARKSSKFGPQIASRCQ